MNDVETLSSHAGARCQGSSDSTWRNLTSCPSTWKYWHNLFDEQMRTPPALARLTLPAPHLPGPTSSSAHLSPFYSTSTPCRTSEDGEIDWCTGRHAYWDRLTAPDRPPTISFRLHGGKDTNRRGPKGHRRVPPCQTPVTELRFGAHRGPGMRGANMMEGEDLPIIREKMKDITRGFDCIIYYRRTQMAASFDMLQERRHHHQPYERRKEFSNSFEIGQGSTDSPILSGSPLRVTPEQSRTKRCTWKGPWFLPSWKSFLARSYRIFLPQRSRIRLLASPG